jgi:hypothetical protein
VIQDSEDQSIPALARAALQPLVRQLHTLDEQVETLDREIKAWHTRNETSRRLATIPGIGVLTASAIAATVPDPSFFSSGREFAAWPDPKTKFERRQRVAWTNIQEGKHLYPTTPRHRSDVNVALCTREDSGGSR